MGSKSEALAKQFEAKVRDAMTTLEGLGAEDWKMTTAAEKMVGRCDRASPGHLPWGQSPG